ncbi:MAG TPA: sugar ABC transporter permease [Devosia sp.]|nr:sugar ABC transporter permease [Devosia sp.]
MAQPAHIVKLERQNLAGWLMAAPAFVLLFMFLMLPFLLGFVFSLTDQRLVSPNPTQFVGLSNFAQLLGADTLVLAPERDASGAVVKDETGAPSYPSLRDYTRDRDAWPQYYGMKELFAFNWGDSRIEVLVRDLVFARALLNTFAFVIVVAPVQGGLALLLALLINQKLRGINVFRTIYFMPVVISIVVVALLWRFIYDGRDGLLNTLLGFLSFGLFRPVDWLGQPSTALWSILGMSAWQGVGFHMVIWLSGLQTIPASLYEAASIDGATTWQKFRFVTWPGLRNTAVLVLIVITMQAFSLFPQVDVMTQGGPLDSTQSVVYQAVQRGYVKQDIATGSAISVILFVIVLSISLFQRWLTRERHA